MTIIAWDSESKTCRVDTLHTHPNGRGSFHACKVVRNGDLVWASSGEPITTALLRRALECALSFEEWRGPDFSAIVKKGDSEVPIVVQVDTCLKTVRACIATGFGPYVAIGAGADWYYAYRAMGHQHGAAFDLVCEHHAFCGVAPRSAESAADAWLLPSDTYM